MNKTKPPSSCSKLFFTSSAFYILKHRYCSNIAQNITSSSTTPSKLCVRCGATKSMIEFLDTHQPYQPTEHCRQCRQENQTTRTSRKRKAADDDEPVAGNLQQQSPAPTATMSNIQSVPSAPFAKRLQDTLRAPIPAAPSTTPVNQSLAYAVALYPPSGPAQTTPSSEFIASRTREYGPAPAPSLDNRTGNAPKGDDLPKWKYDPTSR